MLTWLHSNGRGTPSRPGKRLGWGYFHGASFSRGDAGANPAAPIHPESLMIFFTVPDANLKAIGFVTVAVGESLCVLAGLVIAAGAVTWALEQLATSRRL